MSSACTCAFVRTVAARATRQTSCRFALSAVAGRWSAVAAPVVAAAEMPGRYRSFTINVMSEKKEKKEIIPGIGKGKTSTGLVGLPVEPDWYNIMLKKFQLLLDTLEASDMPETAQYRMDVTKWANFVIATVKANPDDPEKVEDEVRMGQVEELIVMADDEMIAMRTYIKTRMWELVKKYDEEGPEVDYNPDPMRDEMAPGSDPRTQARIAEDLKLMMNAGLEEEDEEDDELDPEYKEYRH